LERRERPGENAKEKDEDDEPVDLGEGREQRIPFLRERVFSKGPDGL